jgi:ankyrin repeat protein
VPNHDLGHRPSGTWDIPGSSFLQFRDNPFILRRHLATVKTNHEPTELTRLTDPIPFDVRRGTMQRALLLSILLLTGVARAADPLSEALQQGLLAEEVQQDLDAAIASYQSVVDQHDAQRRWVATALFRLGESYRKQGKTAEAIASYRRLIAEFDDQTELARMSRHGLENLAPGAAVAAGPLPPGVQRQKELLAQELSLVEQQIAEKRKQISVGRAPSGDLLPLQREALSLQRQMAALDATRADLLSEVLLPPAAPDDAILPLDGVTEEEQRELDRLMELVRNSPDLINFSMRGDPPLHAAARKGQLAVARFLIENGADLGLRDSGSYTPLHRAVEGGHKAMAEMLLAAGANADAAGYSDKRPLHLAAFWGFTEIAKVLLAAGADVNAAARGGTPLHEAIPRERMPMIDLLLDSGADLEAKTPVHYEPPRAATPLMLAIEMNFPSTVEHLLMRGADINASNASGDRVLHIAVQSSRPDPILRALLERGPDLEALSQNLTPLQVACVNRNTSAARLLLEAGANPNVRFDRAGRVTVQPRPGTGRSGSSIHLEADGKTPLHWAVADSDLELTGLLVAHGADPNARDHRGNTPLLGAVWERGERGERVETELEVAFLDFLRQAAALLLSAGADPNTADETGWTLLQHALGIGGEHADPTIPFHHAVCVRALELVERLLEAGADPNAATISGATPMHAAALWPAPNVMQKLLDHGGKIDLQDRLGNTPLHVAARANYHREVVRFLLTRGAPVNARNRRGETPLDIATGRTPYQRWPGVGLIEAFDRHGRQVHPVAAPPSEEIADLLREHGAKATPSTPNPAPNGPAAERDVPSATDPANP